MTCTKPFLISLLCLAASGAAIAQDTNDDGLATMLVPIAFGHNQRLPGAHGTEWGGELWVHNASDRGLTNLQPGSCLGGGCPITIPAGFLDRRSIDSNQNHGGALLHLPADIAPDIHLSARLYEFTRNSQPTGVEIPIISEDEFLSGEAWLLGIPNGIETRSALRIYDPRYMKKTALNVEFFTPEGELVASTVLRPGDDPLVPSGPDAPSSYRFPGFASVLDLRAAFPELNGLPLFHIRLTPAVEGIEYWPMVSVTDDVTQHVLLITAQP